MMQSMNHNAIVFGLTPLEETHLKEDYVIPKANDPRIFPIVTQAIGNHIPKPLKDGTETRQLNEQKTGKEG